MSDSSAAWSGLLNGPNSRHILSAAMDYAAHGLSEMTGRTIYGGDLQVRQMPFDEISPANPDAESAAVGVYLKLRGAIPGWALLSLPLPLALQWADLIQGKKPGAARPLDRLSKSALAEAGNLALSYFLSAVARLTHRREALLPSPPVVLVDMLSVILNLLDSSVALLRDDLLVIETTFHDTSDSIQTRFWIVPEVGQVEQGN